MAVQAVNQVNEASGSGSTSNTTAKMLVSEETFNSMTAAQIIDAENNKNWAVPNKILTWAKDEYQKNPSSKTTYSESSGNGTQQESDAVSYKESLDNEGMSLKDQCKQFTELSSQKEDKDLDNVTKLGPYTQQTVTDKTDGSTGQAAVTKALSDVEKKMNKGGIFSIMRGGSTNFKEGVKFFKALKKGTSNQLNDITESLTEMQNVISESLDNAKDSLSYGKETVSVGKEMKSHTKWWQVGGSRRKAANKAIEQGNKTISMSENTTELAQAVQKDNSAALESLNSNTQMVSETNEPEEKQIASSNEKSKNTPTAPKPLVATATTVAPGTNGSNSGGKS